MLAFLKTFMYNTACRHDIGLSPSGKALDSDSSISGVRIPQAQLETSRSHTGGFFCASSDENRCRKATVILALKLL